MKQLLLTLLFLQYCTFAIAQKDLPIIKATNDKTYFTEGKSEVQHNWWLDPSLELDVYETNKYSKATWIRFHTDIASMKVKLKPGEHYDFIVLLNEKDTCRTRITVPPPILKYAQISPPTQDTIPFELTAKNNLKIKVLLNGRDSLDLHFDTGSTELIVTHDAIAHKTNLLEGRAADFKTKDYQRINNGNDLKIGALEWKDLQLYPVTVTPKGTDGHFGWDLFDGRVVEVDYEKELLIVHSSLPRKPKGYAKLKMEYVNTLFCVRGKLEVAGKQYKNLFLFDSGYQRSILLDSVLCQRQHFPKDLPVIKTTTLRNGRGTVFHTKIINSERMIFGKSTASNIPTQLLNTSNPARFEVHILGNELLKRFNTILDFQNNYVYLKPNSLMDLPYVDAS